MDRSLYKHSDNKNLTQENDTNHLLVIGIDEYNAPIPNLYNAVNDARLIKRVLLERYFFLEQNCISLLNQQATKRGIIAAFDQLLYKVKKEENVILYFSGHGTFHRPTKRGYWIPADGISDDRTTFLSNSEVVDFVKSLKAKHVFCIVDSCFSGALFRKEINYNRASQKIYNQVSRWLLTAGRLAPVSDGNLGENSPFTKALVSKLESNTDILWAGDLCREVTLNTFFNTNDQIPRGEPLQNAGHQGGEFLFIPKEDFLKPNIAANLKPAGSHTQTAINQKGARSIYWVLLSAVILLAVSMFWYNYTPTQPVDNKYLAKSFPIPLNRIPPIDSCINSPIYSIDTDNVSTKKDKTPSPKTTFTPRENKLHTSKHKKGPLSLINIPDPISQDSARSHFSTLPFAKIERIWLPENNQLADQNLKSACAFVVNLKVEANEDVVINKFEVTVKKVETDISDYVSEKYRNSHQRPVFYIPMKNRIGKFRDWFYLEGGQKNDNSKNALFFSPENKNSSFRIRIEPNAPGIYTFDCDLHYLYKGELLQINILRDQKWLFDF